MMENLDFPEESGIERYAKWDAVVADGFSRLEKAIESGSFDAHHLQCELGKWEEWITANARAADPPAPGQLERKDQLLTLQRWTWCAEQAIWATNNSHADRNPLNVHDEVGYAAWVGLSADRPEYICGYEAWAFDCIRLLASAEPPKPLCEVKLPVALIPLEDPHNAIIVELQLDVLPHGAGAAVHDPRHACCSFPEDSFAESMQDALKAARALAFRGDQPRWVYVRWRVVGRDGVPIKEIKDRSAGGMAALHLLLALRMQIPDQGIIVLAACNAEGHLASVDGIAAKVQAVIGDPRFDTIVVHPDNEGKARAALGKAANRIRIETATSLNELSEFRSGLALGLMSYLRYVVDLRLFPGQTESPWMGSRSLAEIYSDPFVRKRDCSKRREDRQEGRDDDPLMGDGRDSKKRIRWSNEWRHGKRFVIVGEPGSGKTMLTRMTMRREAEESIKKLEDCTHEIGNLPLPIWAALAVVARCGLKLAIHKSVSDAKWIPENQWVAKFQRNSIVEYIVGAVFDNRRRLFLDGLDEVPEEDVQGSLSGQLEALRGNLGKVVFASRPYALGEVPHWLARETFYEIALLRPRDRRDLITAWFKGNGSVGRELVDLVQGSPALGQMACNPLLLTILCAVKENPGFSGDVTRVDLYRLGIKEAIRRTSHGKGDDQRVRHVLPLRSPKVLRLRDLLSAIAWRLFSSNPRSRQFTRHEMKQALQEVGAQIPDEVLHAVEDSGLVTPDATGENWIWLHKSILDYLAAEFVAMSSNPISAIEPFLWRQHADGNDYWQVAAAEMIAFLAGCLGHPDISPSTDSDSLIQHLLDLEKEKPDMFNMMSRLVGRCLTDVDRRRINPQTMRQVLLNLNVDSSVGDDWENWRSLTFPDGIEALVSTLLRPNVKPLDEVMPGVIQNLGSKYRNKVMLEYGIREAQGLGNLQRIVEALGNIGSDRAVDVLCFLLVQTRDEMMHYSILNALCQIGSEQAVPTLLLRLATERDADLRRSISKAIGEIGRTEAIPELLKHLTNEKDSLVRVLIFRAVGSLGGSTVVPTLLEHVAQETDRDVRGTIVDLIGELGDASVIPMLLECLKNEKEDEVRASILISLVATGGVSMIPILFKSLVQINRFAAAKSWNVSPAVPEDKIRWMFSSLSTRMGIVPVIGYLEQKLGDAEWASWQIIKILDSSHDVSLGPLLIGVLTEEKDANFRWLAAIKFSEIGASDMVPPLAGRLSKEEDPSVRLEIVKAIGEIASERAVSALVDSMNNEERPELREHIADALGKIASDRTVPALVQRMGEEKNPKVRESIAKALGEIGDEQAVPGLLPLFESVNRPRLLAEIAQALGKIGSEQAVSTLVQRMNIEKDSEVRESIVHALGRIGGGQAVSALVQRMNIEKDSEVRENIIDALGEIAGEQAVLALVQRYAIEKNPDVRASIVVALGNAGNGAVGSILLCRMKHEKNDSVRSSILESLGKLTIRTGVRIAFPNQVRLQRSTSRRRKAH